MNIKFNQLVTLENARKWQAETDKMIFCKDLMALGSIDDPGVEEAIYDLEDAFEALLEGAFI